MTERMVCMGCTLKPKNLKTFPKKPRFFPPHLYIWHLTVNIKSNKIKNTFKKPSKHRNFFSQIAHLVSW